MRVTILPVLFWSVLSLGALPNWPTILDTDLNGATVGRMPTHWVTKRDPAKGFPVFVQEVNGARVLKANPEFGVEEVNANLVFPQLFDPAAKADLIISFKVTDANASDTLRLKVRKNAAQNLELLLNNDIAGVYKQRGAGDRPRLKAWKGGSVNGDWTFYFEKEKVEVYFNGNQVMEAEDNGAPLAAGNISLGFIGPSIAVSNIKIMGELGSVTPPPVPSEVAVEGNLANSLIADATAFGTKSEPALCDFNVAENFAVSSAQLNIEVVHLFPQDLVVEISNPKGERFVLSRVLERNNWVRTGKSARLNLDSNSEFKKFVQSLSASSGKYQVSVSDASPRGKGELKFCALKLKP